MMNTDNILQRDVSLSTKICLIFNSGYFFGLLIIIFISIGFSIFHVNEYLVKRIMRFGSCATTGRIIDVYRTGCIIGGYPDAGGGVGELKYHYQYIIGDKTYDKYQYGYPDIKAGQTVEVLCSSRIRDLSIINNIRLVSSDSNFYLLSVFAFLGALLCIGSILGGIGFVKLLNKGNIVMGRAISKSETKYYEAYNTVIIEYIINNRLYQLKVYEKKTDTTLRDQNEYTIIYLARKPNKGQLFQSEFVHPLITFGGAFDLTSDTKWIAFSRIMANVLIIIAILFILLHL